MPQYDTITLLQALEIAAPVPSFLLDNFVRPFNPLNDLSPTEIAEMDVRKGAVRMAPFVAPSVGGVVVTRDGYQTRTVKFPTLAPDLVVTTADVRQRAFGQNVYEGVTEGQRAQALTARDLQQLREMLALRKEWMVAQILQTGKMTIPIVDREKRRTDLFEVDYNFDNFVTLSKDWDEAGSDPNQDMQALYEAVYEGQGKVDIVLMGSQAANVLLRNDTFYKQLDNRRMNLGEVAPRRYNGLRYIGVNEDGIEMYAYADKFIDEVTGTPTPFIAPNKVIAAGRAMLSCMYGPITQVEGKEMKTYLAREVPHRFADEDTNAVKQRMTSRPMIVPGNVDGWAVMEVF